MLDEDEERDRILLSEGPLADPQERQVIYAVLDSLRQYRANSHYNTTHRRRQNLYALPGRQWEVLAAPPFNILDHLCAVDEAIDHNADIAEAILHVGLQAFGLPENPDKGSDLDWHKTARPGDMAKAHSTIRQFYRDWSAEGFAIEVRPLLNLILADLAIAIPKPSESRSPAVLVPGAGLGRLLFELSLVGYSTEGNEISYHQLLASNFVLNTVREAEQYRLYPFAGTFTNHTSRRNQLVEVKIPDIHPGATVAQRKTESDVGLGEMNMAAGDFLTSYSGSVNEHTFDAVVTLYFIDTAPNLIRYIETIKNCLREGGVWVNVGPLLWHFDDRQVGQDRDSEKGEEYKPSSSTDMTDTGIDEPGSFELTDEEVIVLVQRMGFEITKHEHLTEEMGGYIQDPHSMIQNRYRCSHWVARRLS